MRGRGGEKSPKSSTQHSSKCPKWRLTFPLKCPTKKRSPPPPACRTHLYLLDDPVAPKAGDKLSWGRYSEISVQVQFLMFTASLHQVESGHAGSAEREDGSHEGGSLGSPGQSRSWGRVGGKNQWPGRVCVLTYPTHKHSLHMHTPHTPYTHTL